MLKRIRPVSQMHWYLWEAIVMESSVLKRANELPKSIEDDIHYINTLARSSSRFGDELKERACKVEFELSKLRKQLNAALEKEENERTFSSPNITGVYCNNMTHPN